MAEAITIPSPSVFLRSSPDPAPPSSQPSQHARRQSTEAKKKAARKANATGAGAAGGEASVTKPKQSKSRNGCVTCKAKRLKCGEEKPGCQQCKRRNVECGGYKKDFKWRPFEETNVKINIDRQKRGSPPTHGSAGSSKPTTPSSETAPPLRHTPCQIFSSPKDGKRSSATEEDALTSSLPQRPVKAKRSSKTFADGEVSLLSGDKANCKLPSGTSGRADSVSISPEVLTVPILSQSIYHHPQHVTGHSPTLTELWLPISEDPPNNGNFVNFSLPEGMSFPLARSQELPVDPALIDQDFSEEEIEEIIRSTEPSDHQTMFLTSRRQTPTLPESTASSSENIHLWSGPMNYLYNQPYMAPGSPEMLSIRFDKLTCGILSIMDGPTENPWRTLIWPLSQQSPALYHAVAAMTAFHSSFDIPSLRVVGHEHKQASIRFIQEGIRDNSMSDQMAIATALALGFSESWDQHTVSGNTHIKGAQALVKRALADHQRNPLSGVELARLKFLCNAWVYMDVIARLTAVDSDDSNDFDNTLLFACDPPNMVMGDSGTPGFGIDFGMPIDARLDPLMGCANTLFPLIGRVANLVRKVCRSQTNSPAVISQANDLKVALESWDPPDFIERPEDPTTDVQHTLQTAEAYRWATLLHLHQSVPELPSPSSADLAQRVLQYLATVPLTSRMVIVQIYPLMVAGCEASTAEDRQWVRDRWTAMGVRMRIGVVDKSAIVTEEVWRRRDAYEAQPTTRRKLVATADLQPARQRGAPLQRTPTGFQTSDPGRTGMVFSYVDGDGESNQHGGLSNDRRQGRRGASSHVVGSMDPAYTVRGHLHWVGVMWDWGWEVLLG